MALNAQIIIKSIKDHPFAILAGGFFALGQIPAIGSFSKDLSLLFYLVGAIFLVKTVIDLKRGIPQELPAKAVLSLVYRERTIRRIAEAITKPIPKDKPWQPWYCFHIITGTSGAGKSSLVIEKDENQKDDETDKYKPNEYLNALIRKNLQDQGKKVKDIVILRDYAGDTNNTLLLSSEKYQMLDSNEVVVFILDQFEKNFLLEENKAEESLNSMCTFLENCKNFTGSWYCLIVIRKEWFLYLSFFPMLRDLSFKKAHVIGGFNRSEESKEWTAFKNKISDIVGQNKDVVDSLFAKCINRRKSESYYSKSCETKSEEVLPVEVFSLARGLEFIGFKNGERSAEEDVQVIMKHFFDRYVATCNDREMAKRVLYSLSVKPTLKRGLTVDEISSMVNIDLNEVQRVLTHFTNAGLLDVTGKTHYDWTHDYYAERFNEYSGLELSPIDRDNISILWEKFRKEGGGKDRHRTSIRNGNTNQKEIWGWICFVTSFILLWARAIYPPLFTSLDSFDPLILSHSYKLANYETIFFDVSFLPIAISLTGWAWYVTTFYRKFFSRLVEGSAEGIYSNILPLVAACLVISSILYPAYWVFCTGIGGMAIGIKGLWISKKTGFWGRFFGPFGLAVSCVCGIVIYGGWDLYAARFLDKSFMLNSSNPFRLSYGVLILMIVWLLWSMNKHIDMDSVTQMRGTYARYVKAKD